MSVLPSLLSWRCFWRWGTILKAEDADDDIEGGVVHIEGDAVEIGNTCPVCNLSNNGAVLTTLFVSNATERDECVDGITASLKFWSEKAFVVVAMVEDPGIDDIFANVGVFNLLGASFILPSRSWLLSVVIIILR